jgi:hypothetical protein
MARTPLPFTLPAATTPCQNPAFCSLPGTSKRPAVLFFAVNLSIMGLYVFITYYALKLAEQKKCGS